MDFLLYMELRELRTGKFRLGIPLTVYLNHFHLPKKRRPELRRVSKMALKKWTTNFRLEHSVRKNKTSFADVPLLPEIFRWNDPKIRVPFTFQPDFSETFCMVNNPRLSRPPFPRLCADKGARENA